MNRAVRRQQLKEPKPGKTPKAPRAIPRTGPARTTAAAAGRRSFVPRFALDIINELRKVVWPDRQTVVHLTFVIVVITIAIGALLGGIDFAFAKLIDETLLK